MHDPALVRPLVPRPGELVGVGGLPGRAFRAAPRRRRRHRSLCRAHRAGYGANRPRPRRLGHCRAVSDETDPSIRGLSAATQGARACCRASRVARSAYRGIVPAADAVLPPEVLEGGRSGFEGIAGPVAARPYGLTATSPTQGRDHEPPRGVPERVVAARHFRRPGHYEKQTGAVGALRQFRVALRQFLSNRVAHAVVPAAPQRPIDGGHQLIDGHRGWSPCRSRHSRRSTGQPPALGSTPAPPTAPPPSPSAFVDASFDPPRMKFATGPTITRLTPPSLWLAYHPVHGPSDTVGLATPPSGRL